MQYTINITLTKEELDMLSYALTSMQITGQTANIAVSLIGKINQALSAPAEGVGE